MKIAQQFTAGIRNYQARSPWSGRLNRATTSSAIRCADSGLVLGVWIPPINRWAVHGCPLLRTNGNPVATAPGSDSVGESRVLCGRGAVMTRAVERVKDNF